MQAFGSDRSRPMTGGYPIPRTGDAAGFAADCLLFSSFVIAIGVPIYYFVGLRPGTWLSLAYALSAAILPTIAPFVIWLLAWGRPVPRRVHRIAWTTTWFTLPALVVAAAVVWVGLEIALMGVAVMSVAGAVLIAVAGARFREYPAPLRLWVCRGAFVVLTPVLLLWLTNVLPHGIDAIGGWAIPVPVAAAGAVGTGWGFWRQMRLRDERRI